MREDKHAARQCINVNDGLPGLVNAMPNMQQTLLQVHPRLLFTNIKLGCVFKNQNMSHFRLHFPSDWQNSNL